VARGRNKTRVPPSKVDDHKLVCHICGREFTLKTHFEREHKGAYAKHENTHKKL